ncbi:mitochondrial protein Pet127-domain-containing protein [Lentinula aff. detonsa]|uniref:Mitochondrial protein Pet127-domain-containing protein n=1 Tax=Lentinula aff. detonsa TaxID=2804958 RepID=A0AA38KGI7_9AGAR|nr:mitochondrial protein Pet127-domain-containing protein [Lentinula aff. detonsa]
MRLSTHGRLQLSPFWLQLRGTRSTKLWRSLSSSVQPFLDSTPSPSPPSRNDSLLQKLKAITKGEAYQSAHAIAVTETLKGVADNEKPKKKKKKKKKKKAMEMGSELSGWSGENWKEDWGEDALRLSPPSQPRSAPPHISLPISYSRRIEGLLEDIPKTVLQDLTPPTKQNPIATLHHGLERVLFNPGVHWLRDPRSRVYNFPPALGIIPKVMDFAFERLTGFIRSSRDEDLWTLAKQEKRKFGGSTSSLSGMLCHVYFLLSGNKTVDTSTLSLDFRRESPTFTPGQRMAASVIFNYKDGVYSIDSGSSAEEDTDKNVLLWMGTILEKYITMPSEEFLSYMRSHPAPPERITEEPTREAYRYSKSEKFVLRSQLDCHDSRLPGTGVFDIKTRACLPVRMDILNFEENSGYLIRSNTGLMESFEREYYDLIRSAFLKYQFQARIGNMDGVFVAYHNTARMFGFQYVPLQEMDERLFGSAPGVGDRVFQKCMETLELVSDEIIACFPGQSVKCTFETQDGIGKDLNIWVELLDWEPKPPENEVEQSDEVKAQQAPIKQIVVTANSFCGNVPAKGARCVGTMDQPWTVHWTITHRTSDSHKEDEIRAGLQAAKDRCFRAHNLPTGVSLQNVEEWWNALDFSGSKKLNVPLTPLDDDGNEGIEVNVPGVPAKRRAKSFFENNFTLPDPRIQFLRDLANQGREETIRIGLEDRGKPKVVLGAGEIAWEDTLAEDEIAAQIRRQEAAAKTTAGEADAIDTAQTEVAESRVSSFESP